MGGTTIAGLTTMTTQAGSIVGGHQERRKTAWRSGATALIGLVLLSIVVAVVWRLGDARKFAQLLERSRPEWLLVAVALQAGTYVCAGSVWWLTLRRAGGPQPLRTLVLLSVAKLFTDQALPSAGISGTLLLVRAIVRRGTSLGLATAALVVNLLGFYGALVVAAGASLAFLWTKHDVSAVLVAMAGLLFLVALAVPSGLFLLLRGGPSRLPGWLRRFRSLLAFLDAFAQAPRDPIRDPVVLGASFGLQLATIVLDAATLYAALAAVGEQAPAGAAFASFVFAMIAEVVGVAPGGLGTFEGTCVALLHVFGVPLEPALAATLLLRGFTFWLPMLPGMWLVHRELTVARPTSTESSC